MRKCLFALVAAGSIAGCAAAPTAGSPVAPNRMVLVDEDTTPSQAIAPTQADSSTQVPGPTQADVSRQETPPSQANVPTQDDMKRLVPPTLTRDEAAKRLIPVDRGQVQVPRDRPIIGGLGTVPGISGLYPFSWAGSTMYAPYYQDTLGTYSPYFMSPYAASYPYLMSPFSYVNALGCYAPFGSYGLGAYGLGYGGLYSGLYSGLGAWPFGYGAMI